VSPDRKNNVDVARRQFLSGRLGQSRPQDGLAVLSRGECLAWDGVVCISCSTICPENAVSVDAKGRPAIMDEACTGCALCVEVCPTRAISGPAPLQAT
jgi:ferredoxin